MALTEHFRIKACVCVNKSDLNIKKTEEIEEYCRRKNVPVVGRISYDPCILKSVRNNRTIIEESCPSVGYDVEKVWSTLLALM